MSAHRQEATYRWNVETGAAEFVGCNLGRNYPKTQGWIYGTIDVDGLGFVADYKFEGSESHTEPVESNPQTLFASMCKAKVERWAKVTAALIHIKPDGTHWTERVEYDALDLDIFEAALRKCIANVREAEAVVAKGGTPDVKRGNWCRYCGAASSCPAVTGLIRSMAQEPQLTADQIRAALTPATAAKAYARLKEVEHALNAVKQAVYLYASECPIDLGEGRVYGPRESQRESIDATAARAVLAAKFGPEWAEAACTFETSKTAVQRAIGGYKKAVGSDRTAAALMREVMDELRQAGAVETKRITAVREYRNGEKDNG